MVEKECDLACLLNAQVVHVVVTMPFGTAVQRALVCEAERALGQAGIHFDRGTCGMMRDWYWDWSLKGCRVVMSKKQPARKRRLKLPLFKTQGLG